MGACLSRKHTVLEQPPGLVRQSSSSFYTIRDQFTDIEQVQKALRRAGLESSNLVLGIDFTKSNTWTGERSFGGRCLHEVTAERQNPYQQVISIIGRTLEAFDDDKLIPAYGFGDNFCTDKVAFPFYPNKRPCHGFEEVLQRYGEIAPGIVLAGPTSFAPIIREAVAIVSELRSYHILVIIADGQVTSRIETEAAIVEASNYALSIVVVGVGDGPWEMMEEFDDELPQRTFDNFQFVSFNKIMSEVPRGSSPDAHFALHALQEIPEQFQLIQRLRLL